MKAQIIEALVASVIEVTISKRIADIEQTAADTYSKALQIACAHKSTDNTTITDYIQYVAAAKNRIFG